MINPLKLRFLFKAAYILPVGFVSIVWMQRDVNLLSEQVETIVYSSVTFLMISMLHPAINILILTPARYVDANDGDTFQVWKSGEARTIRPQWIDAPEYKDDSKAQKYGKEARDYLRQILKTSTLHVRDNKAGSSYGRDLRQVYANGEDVGIMMLKAGMAHIDTRYPVPPNYVEAYAYAMKHKIGLHSEKFTHPEIYRRSKAAQKENLQSDIMSRMIEKAGAKK